MLSHPTAAISLERGARLITGAHYPRTRPRWAVETTMLARRTDKERLEQEERLVNTRREGKQIFYSIASKEALA